MSTGNLLRLFPTNKINHICVDSFSDNITNDLISMFVFFFNFIRDHLGLNNFILAQVAGRKLSKKQKNSF